MICTKCEVGELVASGEAYMGRSPQYANYCKFCLCMTLHPVMYGTKEEQKSLKQSLQEEIYK